MLPDNIPPGLARVWVATLADADLGLRAWLDDRERERLARYRADADRARFLLGATMLRAAVGAELGSHPRDVPVDRACGGCGRWHGRPVVPGSGLSLSVSHGGLVVVLALAAPGPVGVDVERLDHRPLEDVRDWACAEARFKAGEHRWLTVRELPAPVPGHVLVVATPPGAPVQVLPSTPLLRRPGPPPETDRRPPRSGGRGIGRAADVRRRGGG